MNSEKSIEERIIEQRRNTGPWSPYNNYQDTVHAAKILEDINKVGEFTTSIQKLINVINTQQSAMEDDNKDKAKLIDLMNKLVTNNRDTKEASDWNKTGTSIQKTMKEIDKSLYLLKGQSLEELRNVVENSADIIESSEKVFELMKKKMQTFSENLSDNLSKVSKNVKEWANFLNLQQIAFGGRTLEDLRTMQAEAKRSMNVDNSGFRNIQGSLIQQNRESYSVLGLSFKDSINYMSSIKDYSMKNYNQSVALYKQVSVGTKYLGMTNQNISDLVRIQNTMADSDYMSKQMALLATLGNDSGLSENIGDLVSFIGQNATSVAARYINGNQMMTDALAIKSTSDALFGNESSLVNNLMSEIMSKSDYSQLSAGTQQLLAYTGQANNVWQQMRSGNVDFSSVIQGVLSNTSGLAPYQRANLENLGLGEWVTLGGTYSRNNNEYIDTLNKQLDVLSGIDVTNKEQVDAALASIKGQNETKTWYEKMFDAIGNFIGVQNFNWNTLLGIQQALTGIITGSMFILDVQRNSILAGILKNQAVGNITGGKDGITKFLGKGVTTWLGSNSMKASIGGKALSNGAALGIGAAGIGVGALMGIYHGKKMEEQGGSFARGLFLGTGYKGKSTGENALSVAGNTAKYTAIGAGIGTIIPVIGPLLGAGVGALTGLVTGIVGVTKELKNNTTAVGKNTDTFKTTNDRIFKNSAMSEFFEGRGGTNDGFGMGGSDSSSGGYPWRVTSPFGTRDAIINGKVIKGRKKMHYGVDFGAKRNTPIGAAMSGKVTLAGWTSGGGGYMTVIQGDDGWNYKYMHQVKTPPVSKGQRVAMGDTIGFVGSTGNSTGPHLHFQVDKGGNSSAVNPLPYVTSGLFSASGKAWNKPESFVSPDLQVATENDGIDSSKYFLTKESLFSTGGMGGADNDVKPISDSNSSYATSADIDRLIQAITSVRDEQEEQRSMMRALAGKNTFVFSGR